MGTDPNVLGSVQLLIGPDSAVHQFGKDRRSGWTMSRHWPAVYVTTMLEMWLSRSRLKSITRLTLLQWWKRSLCTAGS